MQRIPSEPPAASLRSDQTLETSKFQREVLAAHPSNLQTANHNLSMTAMTTIRTEIDTEGEYDTRDGSKRLQTLSLRSTGALEGEGTLSSLESSSLAFTPVTPLTMSKDGDRSSVDGMYTLFVKAVERDCMHMREQEEMLQRQQQEQGTAREVPANAAPAAPEDALSYSEAWRRAVGADASPASAACASQPALPASIVVASQASDKESVDVAMLTSALPASRFFRRA